MALNSCAASSRSRLLTHEERMRCARSGLSAHGPQADLGNWFCMLSLSFLDFDHSGQLGCVHFGCYQPFEQIVHESGKKEHMLTVPTCMEPRLRGHHRGGGQMKSVLR